MLDSGHHQELMRFNEIIECIVAPDKIYKSKNSETSRTILLVKENVTSTGGDALLVPIKNVSSTESIFVTAYYSSDRAYGALVWSRHDDNR